MPAPTGKGAGFGTSHVPSIFLWDQTGLKPGTGSHFLPARTGGTGGTSWGMDNGHKRCAGGSVSAGYWFMWYRPSSVSGSTSCINCLVGKYCESGLINVRLRPSPPIRLLWRKRSLMPCAIRPFVPVRLLWRKRSLMPCSPPPLPAGLPLRYLQLRGPVSPPHPPSPDPSSPP